MADFPKLLVATEFPPNASGGGPAVVRQMLAGYPTDRLSWWSVRSDSNKKFGQNVGAHRVARLPEKLYPYRRLPVLKSGILENFWAPWAARHLRKTIEDLKPEAIWIIPHDWSIFPLAGALLGNGDQFHCSIHDYVGIHDQPRRFGANRCERMAGLVDQLYVQADTRDAICQPMAEDLERRTGAKADQIARAGVEPEDFALLEKGGALSTQQGVRIAYAGSILVPEVFRFFVEALNLARLKLKALLTLELFGAHSHRNETWFESSWMHERGNLTEPDLKKALRECHWGFVPMSLRDDEPRYNRISFPTKYVSCLATGLPTIVLAHEATSVAKIARAYATGFYSGTSNREDLAAQLKVVLSEANPREKFRNALLNCARKEFDATQMRKGFLECLSRVAKSQVLPSTHL